MIRIDGFYLYSVRYTLHPLGELTGDAPFDSWAMNLFLAQTALEGFIQQSVFQVQTSRAAGNELLGAIKALTADFTRTEAINYFEAAAVTGALSKFETVLTAELGMMNIYLVLKKRGYDTTDLILNGFSLFPEDLVHKVPGSIVDINFATKCIAYELPTAAGFYLHRANESVLHSYYDAVTNGAQRPGGRNIGDYLKDMDDKKCGNLKVKAALRDLKDLHRNPLIHPEDSLDSVDDAIALLGGIQAVIIMMLKEIPFPTQPQIPLAAAPQPQSELQKRSMNR